MKNAIRIALLFTLHFSLFTFHFSLFTFLLLSEFHEWDAAILSSLEFTIYRCSSEAVTFRYGSVMVEEIGFSLEVDATSVNRE